MEPELAQEAVETMQAAPVAGAGNEREQEKSALLDRMAGGVAEEEEPVAEEHREIPEAESEGAQAVEDEEAAAANEVAERAQDRESVARDFPDALREGSELFEACQEEMAYLLDANSPLASDPQAEYKIARRMARVLGYAQRGAVREPEVPAVPVKLAVPQRRSVRPMPTGGAPVESPATTLERRVAGAKSTGEMLELMREIGTPFEALLQRR